MQTALIVLGAVCLVLIAVIVCLVLLLRLTYEDIRQNYAPVNPPDVFDWDYTKETGWVR